jgi:hypothetical protein
MLLKSMGSTSKLVGAMDARWQKGHACMILRYLHRGYGCSLAVKQCQEREVKKTLRSTTVDLIFCCGVTLTISLWIYEVSPKNDHSNYVEDH